MDTSSQYVGFCFYYEVFFIIPFGYKFILNDYSIMLSDYLIILCGFITMVYNNFNILYNNLIILCSKLIMRCACIIILCSSMENRYCKHFSFCDGYFIAICRFLFMF